MAWWSPNAPPRAAGCRQGVALGGTAARIRPVAFAWNASAQIGIKELKINKLWESGESESGGSE